MYIWRWFAPLATSPSKEKAFKILLYTVKNLSEVCEIAREKFMLLEDFVVMLLSSAVLA